MLIISYVQYGADSIEAKEGKMTAISTELDMDGVADAVAGLKGDAAGSASYTGQKGETI